MSQYGKAGFQDMPKVVHRAASRKGGKIKTRKGLGAMSPEKRRQIQSMGGRTKYGKNRSEKGVQTEAPESGYRELVDGIFGDIDE